MINSVEAFYDALSEKFIEDLVLGNERIERQLRFFLKAIPGVGAILVIGFGSGEVAFFIAHRIARKSRVLAVDISARNLQSAQTLFSHPRVEYRKVDVTRESIEGQWDLIVMPDVYEHIPKDGRPALHRELSRLLHPKGRLLLTVPSPGKQASLYASGVGLQVVDEIVTLEDLVKLASEVGGLVTYFNMISVWEANDYIHVMIERGADHVRAITEFDKTPLKGWPSTTLLNRGWHFLLSRLGIVDLHQHLKRRRLRAALRRGSTGT